MHPVEQLKMEHENILRGVGYLKKTGQKALKEELLVNEIKLLLDFFKGYADAGHHAKEEDILFTRLKEINPDIDLENTPVGVLKQQHIEGRSLVKSLSEINSQYPRYVDIYSDLLNRHIEIEDNVFPVLVDDYLSDADVRMMTLQFSEADAIRDINKYLKILDTLAIQL